MAITDAARATDAGVLDADALQVLADDGRPLHRFTFDEALRMVETGILSPDARVELLEGVLVTMAPIGDPHMYVVNRATRRFVTATPEDGPDGCIVSVQNSIALTPRTHPEPDLAVYASAVLGPGVTSLVPSAALLVIEVCDTTLRSDRRVKVPIYARSGVAEVWLIDIPGRAVERYLDPVDGAYRSVDRLDEHAELAPTRIPAFRSSVADLLPPQR